MFCWSFIISHRVLFQVPEDVIFLQAFYEAIRARYKDCKPLYLEDPEKSAFTVMTETEFEGKTVQQIQQIFQTKHIIITEMQSPSLKFDSAGLLTVVNLSRVTDIQGW